MDEFDDNDIDTPSDIDDADILCGMMHDGFCGNAGTEYCEFECPYGS